MIRPCLLRFALGTAGALGILVLGAGIRRLGLPTALGVVTFCALAGAAASLGWHLVAAALDRSAPELEPDGRHRASRPDGSMQRRPRMTAAPQQAPEPSAVDAQTPAQVVAESYDPYLAQAAEARREHETTQPLQLRDIDLGEFDQLRARFEEHIEPFLTPPTPRWMGPAEASAYEDIYAHPGTSTP